MEGFIRIRRSSIGRRKLWGEKKGRGGGRGGKGGGGGSRRRKYFRMERSNLTNKSDHRRRADGKRFDLTNGSPLREGGGGGGTTGTPIILSVSRPRNRGGLFSLRSRVCNNISRYTHRGYSGIKSAARGRLQTDFNEIPRRESDAVRKEGGKKIK